MRGKTRGPAASRGPGRWRFNEAPAICGGKRRPLEHERVDRDASMRPPQYAGENLGTSYSDYDEYFASMRPPQYAGENNINFANSAYARSRFNEAPAICGGKPVHDAVHHGRIDASMRPPQYAGENIFSYVYGNLPRAASMRPPQYAGENSHSLLRL